MTSLAVLGVGRIGGECAFAASALGIVDELILADVYEPLLRAQVLDLSHAPLDIPITTDRSRIREADICIFAAGSPRNPSVKTRADLFDANLPVAEACMKHLNGFSGTLIVVSNPMDVFTYYFQKKLQIPRERCIGFGGQLDSRRFEVALRNRRMDGDGWVIGEHGEHQIPLFSKIGIPVPDAERDAILTELRGASMAVIQGKGGTAFGPALHITDLIRMLTGEKDATITCSLSLEGEYGFSGCAMGVPARISRGGAEVIGDWELDQWEEKHLHEAGGFLQSLCRRLDV
ncbi:lactate dehydrogenase [Methanocalculus chunghsingensis]|uniref:malate dehydrogenase n=1 Tax=Methanocalculus chunghsingensis TaxID=156457 RepID=A0A8J7W858_9EURY|nr:lactate dehydrogenase [Methanocalculus chunghsingensis]MBR1368415.1 lactate dehydrogenase [Methanocalculus chunghsingensis]